eukprot:Unigene6694_Nuclearia_a/m.20547 Unigene6694_Nuclearia_a/g.20547  ORF Unigene6694_Nuclearia_a/g.20547 Unigene6694_Nuclearia_a/m.20547 type:complete len:250 (+) Unigene6694_Nuclearia_a:48-797(+)
MRRVVAHFRPAAARAAPHRTATRRSMPPTDLDAHDPVQAALMRETIVVVDADDNVLGHDSKENCHLMDNINKGLLHRAFSVFLFNDDNQLLLQQRAGSKITFPLLWTNTCCSHPLHTPKELEQAGRIGIKRAAQRKLEQELGIAPAQVPLSAFHFLTRIHYKAPSDGRWGEHEVDYILFAKARVDLTPNPNEVNAVRYVSQGELRKLIQQDVGLTPWFRLIADSHLFPWWDTLARGEALLSDDLIHRML